MARWGKCDFKGMEKLHRELERAGKEADPYIQKLTKELAARLLALVIKRTPVGDYSKEIKATAKRDSKNHKKGEVYTKRVNPSKQLGGTLRRGWTSKTHEEAAGGKGKPTATDVAQHINSLKIEHNGSRFTIELVNPVEYASYVEYGHTQTPGRYVPALGKSLKKGWALGKFMLTISEDELTAQAPAVIEARIAKWLEEMVNGE